MEWIVITPSTFYYGTERANGPGNENNVNMLAKVDDHFKPWAKKLLRNYNDLQRQIEVKRIKEEEEAKNGLTA